MYIHIKNKHNGVPPLNTLKPSSDNIRGRKKKTVESNSAINGVVTLLSQTSIQKINQRIQLYKERNLCEILFEVAKVTSDFKPENINESPCLEIVYDLEEPLNSVVAMMREELKGPVSQLLRALQQVEVSNQEVLYLSECL